MFPFISTPVAAAIAASNPKFKRRKISPAKKKKAEQEIAERVESMVKAAKKEGEAEIKAAEEEWLKQQPDEPELDWTFEEVGEFGQEGWTISYSHKSVKDD